MFTKLLALSQQLKQTLRHVGIVQFGPMQFYDKTYRIILLSVFKIYKIGKLAITNTQGRLL